MYRDGRPETVAGLAELRRVAYDMKDALLTGNLKEFGALLDVAWQSKQRANPDISDDTISEMYETARRHGAIGGKLLGAGGGGYLLFFCQVGRRRDVREKLEQMEGNSPISLSGRKVSRCGEAPAREQLVPAAKREAERIATPLPAISRGRLVRWLALGLVAAAACYLAVTGLRLLLVYREMLTAEQQLGSAETLLRREGLEPSPAALAQAEVDAAAAADNFRSAGNFFAGEPLLSALARLPWLGEQVATARDLAAIGYDASRIGLAGVSALRALSATSADRNGPVGQELIGFMRAVEPQTAEIRQRLSAVREKRDRIAGRHSAPPLASFVERVDERLLPLETGFQRYESARAAAPELLGQERPMTYLVLGLDNTESCPAAGSSASTGWSPSMAVTWSGVPSTRWTISSRAGERERAASTSNRRGP